MGPAREVARLLRQGHGCPVSGTAGKTLDGLPVLEIEPKTGRQPWALGPEGRQDRDWVLTLF